MEGATVTDLQLPKLGAHVRVDRQRDPIEGEVVRHFGDAIVIEDDYGTRIMITQEEWATDGGVILKQIQSIRPHEGYL